MNIPHISGRRAAIALTIAAASVGGVAGALIGGSATNVTLTASTAASSTSTSASPGATPEGHGARGMHGPAVGTVTAVSAANKTLTLRTLLGSLTVTTTSITKYTKEGKTIAFSDISADDVVAVRGTPSGGSDSTPPTSVAASAITVRLPSAMGRVQSVSGNTITIVTHNGQLLTVTTSDGTKYRNHDDSAASAGDVKAGSFIAAEGTRADLTDLNADVITILPAPGTEHHGGFPGGGPRGPGGPGAADPTAFDDLSE